MRPFIANVRNGEGVVLGNLLVDGQIVLLGVAFVEIRREDCLSGFCRPEEGRTCCCSAGSREGERIDAPAVGEDVISGKAWSQGVQSADGGVGVEGLRGRETVPGDEASLIVEDTVSRANGGLTTLEWIEVDSDTWSEVLIAIRDAGTGTVFVPRAERILTDRGTRKGKTGGCGRVEGRLRCE